MNSYSVIFILEDFVYYRFMNQHIKKRERKAPGVRRAQLIEATIQVISEKGLSALTLADVCQAAGLSQGIVNLHFKSKDNLLKATLIHLQEEYEATWRKALKNAGDNPSSKLEALLKADFKASIVSRKKLAVWFAFWGEVKSRPTYKTLCQNAMQEKQEALREVLQELIDAGNYQNHDAGQLAETLTALADGLWLNMLINGASLKRKQAEAMMLRHVEQLPMISLRHNSD